MKDIINREIDLIEMKFEDVILTIEDRCMTEGVASSIGDTVGKIIEKIKVFFSKLKTKIQEKLRSAKIEKSMKVLRSAMSDSRAFKKPMQYDQTKDLVRARTEKFFKDCDKILTMKYPAKIEPAFIKCYNEANKDIDAYINASKASTMRKKWLKTVTLNKAARMVISDVEKMNSEMDNMCKRMTSLCKKSASISRIIKESTDSDKTNSSNLSTSISSKVSTLGSKSVSFITKVGVDAIIELAAIAASGLAYKTVKSNLNKGKNAVTNQMWKNRLNKNKMSADTDDFKDYKLVKKTK